MNSTGFSRRAILVCAASAVFAGCALPGALPVQPSGATGAAAAPGASWVAPDAGRRNLLYVSDVGTGKVNIYSYPDGNLEGVLSGFVRPQAMCVDKYGDVFIPDLEGFKIYEYRHGARKPKAVLRDPAEDPDDCAVDPATGDLAVANLSTPYSGSGDIVVYAHARGRPKRFREKAIRYYLFCGYDDRGDLFLDGMDSGVFKFAEMPKGSGTFTNITLDKSFRFGGAVQWDGHNIAIGDRTPQAAERVTQSDLIPITEYCAQRLACVAAVAFEARLVSSLVDFEDRERAFARTQPTNALAAFLRALFFGQ